MLNKRIYLLATLLPALLFIVPGCKKYVDPPPFFEVDTDTLKQAERKMLIIGIDGASGPEYAKIKPPTMMEMKTHSKFSWEAVSDDVSTDAASWKTLLSGVSYSRHHIRDSTLVYTQDAGGHEHGVIETYPTFLTYLLGSSKSDTRIVAAASWDNLLTKLLSAAETKKLASDDAAVKDSAISLIKAPASDVIFVHFNGVARAGKEHGFSADAAGYVNAVKKVDGYIGELMKALKERPEYNKKEEWLVVIVGTHAGKGNTYGGSSAEETTVPAFYYNENFLEKELVTEGLFSGVEIRGQGDAAIKAKLLDDGGLYNPGRGEHTVQLKVKGTSGSYPHFMSKMSRWPSQPGWSMFTAGANWAMSIRSTTSGEVRAQSNNQPAFDGKWHTISFTIADSAGGMYLRRYTDGIRNETRNISSIYNNNGSVETDFPLTLGWGADPGFGATNFVTADVMIFNTALSDQEIFSSICMLDMSQHPKYKNLIGYWPANDGFGGRFKNRAPNQKVDFILSGSFQWARVDERPCTSPGVGDPGKESLLAKAVDLAPIFFYWLKVDVKDNWNLEGTNWLNQYEIEFVDI